MKKSRTKVWAGVLSAAILSSISICGTIAYLTTEDTIVNTLTVGQVDIELDEAAVTPDGQIIDGAERVKENKYHLLPGHTYAKDPTITVKKGSKESYVRIMVSINKFETLNNILGNDFKLHNYISGWDSDVWEYTGAKEVVNDTITYEFRYFEPVNTRGISEDVVLDELFDSITIPNEIDSSQLKMLNDLEIRTIGHAIQKEGFDTKEDAWEAFEKQDK